MKILFVLSETLKKKRTKEDKLPLTTQEDIHLGVSYISALLEANGYITDLYIVTNSEQFSGLDKLIKDYNPQVICFSAVYREFETIVKVSDYIKVQYPNIFQVAGGAHITLNPEIAIQKSFDAICIGEGEYPTLELIQKLEKNVEVSNIKNMWIKTEQGIERNETREYLSDLNSLPFPNRKMWQKYIKKKNSLHDIIVGRGCPFNCTYCCNHALRKVAPGCYVRFRDPANIIAEIKLLLENFPDTETIFFEAEAINLNPEFLDELTNLLSEFNKTLNKPIAYGANIRLNSNTDIHKVMKQFVRANIIIMNIGLESGSERVRKEVLYRAEYTNDDVRLAVKLAKKYHRHVMLFVLLGIPGETYEDCQQTLALVKECRPNFIHLGIFTPYPGTVLYENCVRDGLIEVASYKEKGRNIATFNTQYMTKKQIQKEYNRFFPEVYARNKREYYILRIICYLVFRRNWNFWAKFGLKYLR